MAALEPVSIRDLAQHIQAADYVDVRVVDVGTVQRCRIVGLNIRRDGDEVQIEQKWEDGAGEVHADMHTFDCEEIRFIKPTEVRKPADVRPIIQELRKMRVDSNGGKITGAILDACSTFFHKSIADITGSDREAGALQARQVAMWLTFEMTDLSPPRIATRFGYISIQPLTTLRYLVEATATSEHVKREHFVGAVVKLAEEIDASLGQTYRRPDDVPPRGWGKLLA